MLLICTKGYLITSGNRVDGSLGWGVPGTCWEQPAGKGTEDPLPAFLWQSTPSGLLLPTL